MLTISIWIIQEIILSKYTPRNFEALFSFVLLCSSFLFLVELNKEYFVLEIFQNSLLALCQVATFCSSSSIILKTFSLLLSQVNKIASYANITGVQLLIGSLTYMRNKSGPMMELCCEPICATVYVIFVFTELCKLLSMF